MIKKQITDFDIIAKYNTKIYQKKLVLDRKYSKMISNRKEKLDARKEREMSRFESKMKKAMDIELHNLTHKRKRSELVDRTVAKIKAKALALAQRYAKLKRAIKTPNWIMVLCMDTMQWNLLDSNVHGWHVYPQSNYSWMRFDIDNIRPITGNGNWKQLDTKAEWRINLPKDIQCKLSDLSKEKKVQIYNRNFYEDQIEYFKPLVKKEEKRLWLSKI